VDQYVGVPGWFDKCNHICSINYVYYLYVPFSTTNYVANELLSRLMLIANVKSAFNDLLITWL
jgi:hypothetical protein